VITRPRYQIGSSVKRASRVRAMSCIVCRTGSKYGRDASILVESEVPVVE
jgi:hypothetical protein